MLKYVMRRLFQIVVTLYLYLTLVFFILEAMPGDYSQIYISDPNLPEAARDELIKQLGLDKPLHERYVVYLQNFIVGQWGISFEESRPVWDIILERLPRTMLLFMTAVIISTYFGFILGRMIAWRRGKVSEYVTTVTGITLYTAFTPMLALFLVWIFAMLPTQWTGIRIFPVAQFINVDMWQYVGFERTLILGLIPAEGANVIFFRILGTLLTLTIIWALYGWIIHRVIYQPWFRFFALLGGFIGSLVVTGWIWGSTSACWPALRDFGGQVCDWQLALNILHHMILPVLNVTLISFGGTMLLMRNSMLETIREDYIMAAKAKGLPEQKVRDDHAARNALLPVVTSFVLSLAFAIDGGIITETLFSWPGMGLTLLNSVLNQDMPLAIGALVFTGVFALIAHLVADILYAYLDPRIRYD